MIDGVIVKEISTFTDDRGWLTEIFRTDENNFVPEMSYVSFTKFGVARGPHEHVSQTDFFVFIGPGDFELYLWDNRKNSKTYGESQKIVVGESNKVSVMVPPGVVHGYKSTTQSGSLSINLPDKLFAGKDKKDAIDEIRHEKDLDSKFKIN